MRIRNKMLSVVVAVALVGFVVWLAISRFAPSAPSLPAGTCGVPECFTIRALSGTWNTTTATVVYSIPAASMGAGEPFNLTYAGRGTSASDCVHVYVGLNDSVFSGPGGPWIVDLDGPISICPGQSMTLQAHFHIDDLANPGGTIVGNSAFFVVAPSHNPTTSYGLNYQVVCAGLASIHVAFQAQT
jgi:hypothetical protein